MNHRAIPPQVLKEEKATEQKQSTLDGIVTTVVRPMEFSREALLDAVAKFVACDDQVSGSLHGAECSIQTSKRCSPGPSVLVIGAHRQSTVSKLSCYHEAEDKYS